MPDHYYAVVDEPYASGVWPEIQTRETWIEIYARFGEQILPTWSRTALVGAGGFMWGVFTRFTERFGVENLVLAMIIVTGCAALPLVAHHRQKGSFTGFQADLVALWASFMAGVLLLEWTLWPDDNVRTVVAALWTGTGAVGGSLVVFPDGEC